MNSFAFSCLLIGYTSVASIGDPVLVVLLHHFAIYRVLQMLAQIIKLISLEIKER